jgi:adenylate kinase
VKGIILDGFPRNLEQAQELLNLSAQWGARLAKVVYLDVSANTARTRSEFRRICSKEHQRTYSIDPASPYKPQRKKLDANGQEILDAKGKPTYLCDDDGADLVIRSDDNIIDKRLTEFDAQTLPVVDFFRQRGELAEVNGEQPPADVTREMLSKVEPSLGLSPAP